VATQEGVTFMAMLLQRFHLELVNEDQPQKWGKFDVDPAKRQGRCECSALSPVYPDNC
jgi:hypothetical protein